MKRVIDIDATNQSMGRLASKIAVLLRGKDQPDFQHHIEPDVKIRVTNVKKLKFTGAKLKDKTYYRYSGHPGGIYSRQLSEVFEKTPEKLLKMTVFAMLPKNRMRHKIIKNLDIK